MTRQHIIQRLLYLRNWELINIFLVPGCLYVIVRSLELQTPPLFWYSTALISFILAQGTCYWHLKLQTVRRTSVTLPRYFHRVFLLFKWTNVLLLALYPIGIAYVLSSQQTPRAALVGATLLWLLALLEQINYYHYQLMHDTRNDLRYLIQHRRLRRAPLADDLDRTAPRGRTAGRAVR